MDLKMSADKLSVLEDVKQEIATRSTILSVLVNVINAYLSVHSLTAVELEAIQKAVEKETDYTNNLMAVLAANLGIVEQPKPEVAAEPVKEEPAKKPTSKKKSTKSEE